MTKIIICWIVSSMCIMNLTFAKDILIEVDDPATKEALGKFKAVNEEIANSCPESAKTDFSKFSDCVCEESNLNKVYKANQEKIEAFVDLMKRRTELVNEMVKIKGVFGNWYLSQDEYEIKKGQDINYLKKSLGCE